VAATYFTLVSEQASATNQVVIDDNGAPPDPILIGDEPVGTVLVIKSGGPIDVRSRTDGWGPLGVGGSTHALGTDAEAVYHGGGTPPSGWAATSNQAAPWQWIFRTLAGNDDFLHANGVMVRGATDYDFWTDFLVPGTIDAFGETGEVVVASITGVGTGGALAAAPDDANWDFTLGGSGSNAGYQWQNQMWVWSGNTFPGIVTWSPTAAFANFFINARLFNVSTFAAAPADIEGGGNVYTRRKVTSKAMPYYLDTGMTKGLRGPLRPE
jgi:hypothetical protein